MFSDELIGWLDNFSQSAAVDMGEGGDDKECVAEVCLTCISTYDKSLHEEVQRLISKHGYSTVFKEATKHVRTL